MTDHIDSASSIPLSDPLHSSTTDITTKDSLQITVVRLNANNYLEWTQSVKLAVDGRGKLGYLTGEESRLEPADPSFRKWRSENSLTTAWLLNSMEDHIRKPFMFQGYLRECPGNLL